MEINYKSFKFVMERNYSNTVASKERQDVNTGSREDRHRMLVYFERPQTTDHDILALVEPDWM
jgi:hypothetical protein